MNLKVLGVEMGVQTERDTESVMSFFPVALGKNQSYVPQSSRVYQAEKSRAGQGSSLACICSTETFLRVNGWQELARYHPERFHKV